MKRIPVDLMEHASGDNEHAQPSTCASGRAIPLGSGTPALPEEHRLDQERQRLALCGQWAETGSGVHQSRRHFLHPAHVTDVFCAIAAAARLSPVRLHDLRHVAAMIIFAAGAGLRVVQDLMGHSSITIVADTYAHILPELACGSAEAAAAIVPWQARLMSSAA